MSKLQEQNGALTGKITQLTNVIEKKKKETSELTRTISSLKRTSATRDKSIAGSKQTTMNVSIVAAETVRPAMQKAVVVDEPALGDSNLLEVARKYKVRCGKIRYLYSYRCYHVE
jgi:uncharacterized protein (DUF342 family)